MPARRGIVGLACLALCAAPSDAFAQSRPVASVAVSASGTTPDPPAANVTITGAERTKHSVIFNRLRLRPTDPITLERIKRAGRRAADLPVASRGSVGYLAPEQGQPNVAVEIKERPLFPTRWKDLGRIGGRALILREAEIEIGGPMGHGERFDIEYGWKRERPRWALRATAPAPGPLPGLAALEVSWRRNAFAVPAGASEEILRQERFATRLSFEDWATDRVQWRAGGAYDRFDRQPHVGLVGGLDTRWLGDHLALIVDGAAWRPTSSGSAFASAELGARWRQHVLDAPYGWSAEAGAAFATIDAPLLVWPGADVGTSREAVLRAHKLYERGIVRSEVFGRRLASASVTYEHRLANIEYGAINVAGFLDTARAWRGLGVTASPVQVDVGVGARVYSPSFGNFRLDLGYGLRDGSFVASAGFLRTWPGR
jgi:hypothetical protein